MCAEGNKTEFKNAYYGFLNKQQGRLQDAHRLVLALHVLAELIVLLVVLVVGALSVFWPLARLLCERLLRRLALLLLNLRQPCAEKNVCWW
jgi:hypothetical protein